MNKLTVVDEKIFRELLGMELGRNLDRALKVLENFGTQFSFDVTNVLMHALESGKEEEVLTLLEKHWEDHLKFQHPVVRGRIVGVTETNKTMRFFHGICRHTLTLTPTTMAA